MPPSTSRCSVRTAQPLIDVSNLFLSSIPEFDVRSTASSRNRSWVERTVAAFDDVSERSGHPERPGARERRKRAGRRGAGRGGGQAQASVPDRSDVLQHELAFPKMR